jgi:hypothetical protein
MWMVWTMNHNHEYFVFCVKLKNTLLNYTMSSYTKIFIKIAEDLLDKHLKIISNPPNHKMQLIKCISIMETIIIRKALAYIKLRDIVACSKCCIQLVIITPWWELDNYTQMHVCVKCCAILCENCAHMLCSKCDHNRFLTFDIYQQLVTVYARNEKNEIHSSIMKL